MGLECRGVVRTENRARVGNGDVGMEARTKGKGRKEL